MKKLVLVLAVLLVSLPAMAAVTITADCDGGVYTVSYVTDGNLPRAFALDITVADGTIDAVSDLSDVYDIYPGSIVIIDGEVNDAGSAVCDASYPDTLGGLGTNGITIEMGSLYAAGETAPALSGELFKFTTSEAQTVATVAINGIRGGVVMENPDEEADVTFVVNDCNDTPPVCKGDANGDGWVSPTDLTAIVDYIKDYPNDYYWVLVTPATASYDANGDGWVSPTDLTALVDFIKDYPDDYYWVECGTF